ncbi:MAG: hypothetical protein ACRD5L_16925 [Bryobacteraceae bacterium]
MPAMIALAAVMPVSPALAQWPACPTAGVPKTADEKPNLAGPSKDNPDAHCLPLGLMPFHTHGQPHKMIQTPGLIDDSKAHTKPWTATGNQRISLDTELIEFVRGENEKDAPHLAGK